MSTWPLALGPANIRGGAAYKFCLPNIRILTGPLLSLWSPESPFSIDQLKDLYKHALGSVQGPPVTPVQNPQQTFRLCLHQTSPHSSFPLSHQTLATVTFFPSSEHRCCSCLPRVETLCLAAHFLLHTLCPSVTSSSSLHCPSRHSLSQYHFVFFFHYLLCLFTGLFFGSLLVYLICCIGHFVTGSRNHTWHIDRQSVNIC